MPIGGILVVVAAIASAIWSGVKSVSEKAIDITRDLFKFLVDMFNSFLQVAPKPVKILLFFFFIITFANVVTGFFVQLNFACSGGELREYESIIGGFRGFWERSGEDLENSTTDYEDFINSTTKPSDRFGDGTEYTDILNVRCFGSRPRLSFFSLDFLKPTYWIIILIIGLLISVLNQIRSRQ
jgi:hypothetical protein